MTERKVYKAEEKLKIVLEGMNGDIQISELCRKYGVKPARFYLWKEKLVNSAQIFDDRGRKNTSQERKIESCKWQVNSVQLWQTKSIQFWQLKNSQSCMQSLGATDCLNRKDGT